MNDIRNIEPYGAAMYENRSLPLNIRMAKGAEAMASVCPLRFSDYLGFASPNCESGAVYYSFNSGLSVSGDRFETNINTYPELADELEALIMEALTRPAES